MVVTEEMINILWSYGAERWSKYGKDRLYVGNSILHFIDFNYGVDEQGNKVNITINGKKISSNELKSIYKDLDNAYVNLEDNSVVMRKNNIFIENLITESLNNLYKKLYDKE